MKKRNVIMGDKPSSDCLKYFDPKIGSKLSVTIFITVMTMFLGLSTYIVQNQRSLERKIDVLIISNPKALKFMNDMKLAKDTLPKPLPIEDKDNVVAFVLPKKEY